MTRRYNKLMTIALCAAMALTLLSGCAAPAEPTPPSNVAKTIVDHNGDEVVLPEKIERIVTTSIYPFPSVITMFLNSAEKLVGIHPVSMSAAKNGTLSKIFPEILNASTGFMEGSNLNVEELIKLDPDIVFYNAGNTAEKDLINNAGIPAVGISATKWDYDIIKTYDEWVAILSQIFPEEDKTAIVSQYSKELYDSIQARVKDIPDEDRLKVLFLFQYDQSTMITSGKHFFGQYWAEAGGGINVAEGLTEDNSNAIINMEQVYEWDPEIIYITNFTPTQPDDLFNNRVGGDDWSHVTAVKNGRVHKMPLGSYRSYTPGTDTPLTLMWMAKTMYPDLFSDIDLESEVKSYYSEIYGVTLTDEDVAAMYTPSRASAEGFVKK